MGHVGGPYKSPNSPKVEPEKTFNFDDDVGNLVMLDQILCEDLASFKR